MKKYLLLLLVLFSFTANADFIGQNVTSSATYYVSTTGSDSNNCSASKPCLTIAHTAAIATTSGSLIHINAGTFTEAPAIPISVGVSVECSGSGTTTLVSNAAGALGFFNLISTTEGTNGNQEIRNCNFNGNLVGIIGIYVQGRGNVKVHDVTATQWLSSFLVFNGRADNTYAIQPNILVTGNELYNSTITNSCRYTGAGSGEVQYGGQDGIKIYNNTIDATGRGTSAVTGWPIKYMNGGYSKNERVYGNRLIKPDLDGTGGFGFVVELWHGLGGTQYYNNDILGGAIDLDYMSKNDSTYTIRIFHNVFHLTAYNAPRAQNAISIEDDTNDVIVDSNYFYNLVYAIYVTNQGSTSGTSNLIVQNNIVVDARLLVDHQNALNHTAINNNWYILNNSLYANGNGYWGIGLPSFGTAKNIVVRNNIVVGYSHAPVEIDINAGSIDYLSIENNDFYGNGNSNLLKINTGITVTNQTNQNNVIVDPLLANVATGVVATSLVANNWYIITAIGTTDFTTVGCGATSNTVGLKFKVTTACLGTGTADGRDFRLLVGSPARNAGLDVGLYFDYRGQQRTTLPDIGAVEYDENGRATNTTAP